MDRFCICAYVLVFLIWVNIFILRTVTGQLYVPVSWSTGLGRIVGYWPIVLSKFNHDVSYIKSKVFECWFGIWAKISISGWYKWAMAAQRPQNGPLWAPWPRPRFFSFSNILNGRNGPSIPQNNWKWVRNLPQGWIKGEHHGNYHAIIQDHGT